MWEHVEKALTSHLETGDWLKDMCIKYGLKVPDKYFEGFKQGLVVALKTISLTKESSMQVKGYIDIEIRDMTGFHALATPKPIEAVTINQREGKTLVDVEFQDGGHCHYSFAAHTDGYAVFKAFRDAIAGIETDLSPIGFVRKLNLEAK